ncbi:MAG: hypothetical protein HQ580_16835, partial [Planctomycetes bacterium]|nr:hypothetical protein [Planctomycetota bacterium]
MNRKTRQLGREEQAMIEVGHTTIKPATARLLTLLFIFAITAVPLVQQVSDIKGYLSGKRASAWPQCYDFFRELPSALSTFVRTDSSIVLRVIKTNRQLLRNIHSYENALED